MIVLRRANERGKTQTPWLESYHSFSFNNYFDRTWHHFHDLRVINEDFIEAEQGFGMHPHENMEILTYLTAGRLSHRDSIGNEFTLKPGDWQRMSAGTGILHQEWNQSKSPTHLWQIWVRPDTLNLEPGYEQKNFSRLENQWQLIASPKPNEGALLIHQNMTLSRFYSTQSQELKIDLQGQAAYFQLTQGNISFENETLNGSDAFVCEEESDITLHLEAETELLVFLFAK